MGGDLEQEKLKEIVNGKSSVRGLIKMLSTINLDSCLRLKETSS